MSYLFVHAATDLGLRSGPILGINCHMAEGGGTVGFLSRPNRDGVSVHYVVEYSGRVVQMLLESHMQTAIRIHNTDGSYAIRQDDEANGYGHTIAVAVLGAWADTHTTGGPNNATIGIEVEGYAGTAPAGADPRANPHGGPNDAQVAALIVLIDEIRTRHPDVGLTGHRDHNVKNCPGLHFPWAALGGHGPANGGTDMRFVKAIDAKLLPVAAGDPWLYVDGSAGGKFSKAAEIRVIGTIDAHTGQYLVRIGTGDPYPDGVTRPTDVKVNSTRTLIDAPVPAPPAPDPAVIAAAVNAALDHVAPAVVGVTKAVDEARPR